MAAPSIPRPSLDDKLYIQRTSFEVARMNISGCALITLVAFVVSLTGQTVWVCMTGLVGMLILYLLFRMTGDYFRSALSRGDTTSAQMFYVHLGLLASLMNLFTTQTERFAVASYQKWTITGLFMAVSFFLGLAARFKDPLAPGLAARAIKFVWSFEFCRALYLFLCGLWGSESFKAISVILGVPDPHTIIPIWFVTPERQAAAWQLQQNIGAGSFYLLFAAAPLAVILLKLFGWIGSFFRAADKQGGALTVRSAYFAAGMLLLCSTVGYRNNHLQWLVGKVYIQWLGNGHPIAAKLYACVEPHLGPDTVSATLPCYQTAAKDWEMEIDRLNAKVMEKLPARGTGLTRASFQRDAQRWTANNNSAMKRLEQQLLNAPDRDFKVMEQRVLRANGRADDLQRILDR